jgi:hypothetical protein
MLNKERRGERMTHQAEQQIVKALRSLPWYMFLVPALFSL